MARPLERLVLRALRLEPGAQPRRQLHLGRPWTASRAWNNAFVRAVFDNWQLSGENAFVSGDWSPIFLARRTTSISPAATAASGSERRCRPVATCGWSAADRGRRHVRQPQRRARQPGAWLNIDAFRQTRRVVGTSAMRHGRCSSCRGSSTGTSRSSRTSRSAADRNAAIPLGDLQPAESHAVQHARQHGTVRCARRSRSTRRSAKRQRRAIRGSCRGRSGSRSSVANRRGPLSWSCLVARRGWIDNVLTGGVSRDPAGFLLAGAIARQASRSSQPSNGPVCCARPIATFVNLR